jgi:hypothetical protein
MQAIGVPWIVRAAIARSPQVSSHTFPLNRALNVL